MPKLIKHRQIIEDSWTLLREAEGELPNGSLILPLARWQNEYQQGRCHGVWLKSDEAVETLVDALADIPVIALEFPVFTDGRHFSSARLLKERWGFTGELRAIGDIWRDQLFYLARCGFDAFAVRDDKDLDEALGGLDDFDQTYQAAADNPEPLFQRRC